MLEAAGTRGIFRRGKPAAAAAAVLVLFAAAFVIMNQPAPRAVPFAAPPNTDLLPEPLLTPSFSFADEEPHGRVLVAYIEQGAADYERVGRKSKRTAGMSGAGHRREL